MRRLSNATIALALVTSVLTVIITIATSQFMLRPSGCVLLETTSNNYLKTNLVYFVVISMSWTMIFGLILYLLAKQQFIQNETNLILRRIIKTSVFSLVFLFLSNIIILLVALFVFPKNWPRYPTMILFDFLLVVDSFSIVISYLDSCKILFGCLPTFNESTKQPITVVTVV